MPDDRARRHPASLAFRRHPEHNAVILPPSLRGERIVVATGSAQALPDLWLLRGPNGDRVRLTFDSVTKPRVPVQLFTIRTHGLAFNQPNNFEPAADGKRFLVNTVVGDSDNAPIEMIINWPGLLKKP